MVNAKKNSNESVYERSRKNLGKGEKTSWIQKKTKKLFKNNFVRTPKSVRKVSLILVNTISEGKLYLKPS